MTRTAFARRNDPVTSWDAATRLSEEVIASSQTAVLYLLREYGPQTVDQLCDRLWTAGIRWKEQRIRTACTELAREGTVRVVSTEGRSNYGNPCQVWAAIPIQTELLTRQEAR